MNELERAIKLRILNLNDGQRISPVDYKILNKFVSVLCQSNLTQEEIEWAIGCLWGMGIGYGWKYPPRHLYPKGEQDV
jgi:hypothetical protein